jgi:uncharacterized protein
MDAYIVLGFVSSLCIGMSLGLIGGGGSMLTMPVLVYLFGISPAVSSSYSLFVVGVTSLVGAMHYLRTRQVDYKSTLVFVIPSMFAVYLSRIYLIEVVSGSLIMLLFAVFMLLSSYSMIRDQRFVSTVSQQGLFQMAICGIVIGTLTGLVGAGGGFLIIPVLVLLARLPMRTAVGTSLFIIAIKSLLGFASDYTHIDVNWNFLLPFTLLAVIGIAVGTRLSPRISNVTLKRSFGWVMLILGLGILFKELII